MLETFYERRRTILDFSLQVWTSSSFMLTAFVCAFVVQRCRSRQPTSSTSEQSTPPLNRLRMRRSLRLVDSHRLQPVQLASGCRQCRCSVLQLEWFHHTCQWDQADLVDLHLLRHVWVDHIQEVHSHLVRVVDDGCSAERVLATYLQLYLSEMDRVVPNFKSGWSQTCPDLGTQILPEPDLGRTCSGITEQYAWWN